MLEQPLAFDDVNDHSKLQATVTTPVCLDESIKSLRNAQQAVETNACK